MSSEVLRYVNGKKVRFTGWSGNLGFIWDLFM